MIKNLNKNQKELIYLGVGILVMVLTFFTIRKVRSRKSRSTVSPGHNTFTPGTQQFMKIDCDKSTVLHRGIECHAVTYSQKQINMISSELGIERLAEDGKFGAATEKAFIKLINKPTGTYNEVVQARKQIKPN